MTNVYVQVKKLAEHAAEYASMGEAEQFLFQVRSQIKSPATASPAFPSGNNVIFAVVYPSREHLERGVER